LGQRASRKARPSQDHDPLFNQSVEKAFAILEAFGSSGTPARLRV